ncbi:MAG TPA: serine/threonine protein kinase [Aromatoleum sp.]|uniref:serine/threonine protein kinase n=1 Tax=Aromatoleum sp. TaxID=2307007 RepID=UPI002B465A1C|nr:serine/threonine protein kinase [Aromatoleum sp.]HJV25990.1 serine/threonine protein kinase [Aromatoleum sp.]
MPPGTRFAEYELLSVLGEGRSGIVYLAMDHGLGRQVAIKEYLPAALAARGRDMAVMLRSDGYAKSFGAGLESFVTEAKLLARFDHPALMRVYRFWEANRTAYMAMPHYEGVTVDVARQSMAHAPDEAWLRGLLLPLLDALDVLHGASCYHWDISPEHILLQPDGRPVLLDSGALHVIGEGKQGTSVVLNPGFAPIEQYAESAQLRQGPWTDLYALAAVAYYCVSGYPPVASTVRALDDQLEPLSQIVDRLGRNFPQLNYSVALVSAIERALSVRPQERPQSVAEFRRILLGGRGVAEPVATSPVEATPPHEAQVAHQPGGQQPGSFHQDVPPPQDAGKVDGSFRQRPEPWSPQEPGPRAEPAREAQPDVGSPSAQTPPGTDDAHDPALWAAFESALEPDPNGFGRPHSSRRDAKAGGWRQTVLIGGAAVALIAVGAGGWMMWSEYRHAKVMQRFSTASAELGHPATPRTPSVPPATAPPAELPAQQPAPPASGPAAESPPPAPATAEPAPPAPPPREAAAVEEAPADRSPPLTRLDNTLTKLDKKEQNNPRVLCGARTQFSLYRCMKTECERPKYYEHPECKYLRASDEVRTLP